MKTKTVAAVLLGLIFSATVALVSLVCLSLNPRVPHDAIYKVNIFVDGKLEGNGTGFAVSEHLVVTAAHVCMADPTEDIFVNGHEMVIINVDPAADLCLLLTNYKIPTFLQLALSEPQVDDEVIASGYALGSPSQVVTRGTFIGGGDSPDGTNRYMSSLMVAPGNSGGPLLDSHMHVVGIVVSVLHGYSQVSFASTLPDLQKFLDF